MAAETLIKLCGVTNEDDARACADAGAWAIGMILSPRGPRALDASRAERVRRAIPPRVKAVGVLVDETVERSNELARSLGLDFVQLHGAEAPGLLAGLAVPAIKAFSIDVERPVAPELERLRAWREAFAALVDARVSGQAGGQGRVFDWSTVADPALHAVAPGGRLVLAGGLDATNVAAAIATVRPFAVDVSSGIEASPGKKDRRKIEAFARSVREAHGRVA